MVNSETSNHYEDKKISTTSATFGLLRKELISNLGMKRAKAFLLRYGWNLGVANAKEVLREPSNLEDMLSKGGLLHLQTGQISKMVSERTLETDENGEVVYIYATGKWIDSFEVKEHIKNHGLSNYPVCHTLAGLGSGFTSMITKRKVFLKEVKCRAMGHDECCYEMRLEEEWQDDPDMQEEIQLYKESSFIDELNFTYEQLLDQKNYIEKVSTFHDTLTTKLSEGHSIEEVIKTVSQTLDIPVTIEDLNFQARLYVGIEQDTYETLNTDFLSYISRTRSGKIQSAAYDKTFIIRGKLHNRLVTPIVVQNQTIGYMTFIYTDKSIKLEKDLMFLQRAASSAAIYFLTEKASIKGVENIKGYFLEQLLLKQYSSVSNIIYRGYYMGIDLKEPFYIASLQFSSDQRDTNNIDFHDQVIQSITRYLDMQSYQILITQFENQIVMLLPKVNDLNFKLENILRHLINQFRQVNFRIGISNESELIDSIAENLEESQIVLRINNQDSIVFFEDANIIGTLINSKNMSTIRRKAQKELQPILQLKEVKRDELLKTMYVFLMNGGNLQQSISDLSLSMSGLMYRISKIEKLLNKELRNPIAAYELLLMLDALKILGDIDVS
ncbi:XylR N-terminal domain-containing protein [Lysinibacillus sp. SGAir0095]|uniref:XylR N-terminal domain-containing protein n=1 Tax=Lysinibacillus sp. SGAir0095 TaxID=2070463 RepID=UPI0010CD40A1|nr:XylR N-terminal domain-containing protein [Lysinibacillus sp. SGAir0095]QCR32142.1 polyketide synthase regulator [Lysinibacillus sp. SGAir0095]